MPLSVKVMAEMKAEVERIGLRKQLEAAWDRFCDNCWEPLEDDRFRKDVFRRPDDELIEVHYCRSCMKIDRSRTMQPRNASPLS
jgi:hypothetical protein